MAMALRAGLAAARHGDGAVPSDRAARRHAHAHDRHGARGRAARRGRLPAERRRRALHARATTRTASARRATSSRARCTRRCARAARRPTAASICRCAISVRTTCGEQFKGMVERCADCGFDLAGGLVEVVPTAHYMMGGVVFDADCTHRAARACSPPARTPAACTARTGSAATASPTRRSSAASPATRWRRGCARERRVARAGRGRGRAQRSRRSEAPFRAAAGDLEAMREALYDVHVGRRRHPARRRDGLRRAHRDAWTSSMPSSIAPASPDGDARFNLSWHDWLNLKSLIAVSARHRRPRRSRARIRAARTFARIFRRPAISRPRRSRWRASAVTAIEIAHEPVQFTRVRPGESLVR